MSTPAPTTPAPTSTHPLYRLWQKVFFGAMTVLMAPTFAVCYGFGVRGRGCLPRRGAYLLLSNHQSFLDPIVLGLAARAPNAFLAKEELFAVPVGGRMFRWLGAMPLAREGRALAGLRQVIGRLQAGVPVVMFPEGARTFDGAMQPLEKGVTLLLKRVPDVPVYVAGIAGAFEAWPRTRTRPTAGRIRIVLEPCPLDGCAPDAMLPRVQERLHAVFDEATAWRNGSPTS